MKYGVFISSHKAGIVPLTDDSRVDMLVFNSFDEVKAELISMLEEEIEYRGEKLRIIKEKLEHFKQLNEGDL